MSTDKENNYYCFKNIQLIRKFHRDYLIYKNCNLLIDK